MENAVSDETKFQVVSLCNSAVFLLFKLSFSRRVLTTANLAKHWYVSGINSRLQVGIKTKIALKVSDIIKTTWFICVLQIPENLGNCFPVLESSRK